MNIRGSKPPEGQEISRAALQRPGSADPKAKAPAPEKTASADRIDISRRSKEIAELMAKIEKLPDVREEKVRQIREAVESGAYEADPRKIAEKILSEL